MMKKRETRNEIPVEKTGIPGFSRRYEKPIRMAYKIRFIDKQFWPIDWT